VNLVQNIVDVSVKVIGTAENSCFKGFPDARC